MSNNRVIRGAFYFILTVVASLAGFYVKKVLVGGEAFSLSSLEIFETVVAGVLVGILIPIIEAKKRNRP